MTKPNVTKIMELSKLATPGPYYRGCVERPPYVNQTLEVDCPPSDSGLKRWPLLEFYGSDISYKQDLKDAAYIAQVSPENVQKILEALEVAHAHLHELYLGDWSRDSGAATYSDYAEEAILKISTLVDFGEI